MKKQNPQIITFSRRTDPAFHMDWLMERIDEGGCDVPNPFSGKPYYISLAPEDVMLLNFWTKDPGALVPYLDTLIGHGYKLAFFISRNGYPFWLEKNVPPLESFRESVEQLSGKLSPDTLWWRYDPIIITNSLTPTWHLESFHKLCEEVWQGNTGRVIMSLAHIDGPYRSIRRKLEKVCLQNDDRLAMPSYEEFIELAVSLSDIARRYNIRAEVCCSPKIRDTDIERIGQASCLSPEYLRKIIPDMPVIKKKGTRKGSEQLGYAPCGCVVSRDIGTYGTCEHGCVYCYANRKDALGS